MLVFAAPAAAGVLDQRDAMLQTLVAFVGFCLAASGTYFLNDANDAEADRLHPTKRNRPIAAGDARRAHRSDHRRRPLPARLRRHRADQRLQAHRRHRSATSS